MNANEKNRKEAEKLMRQKMVENKMESLINSSVDAKIKLVPGDNWGFDANNKQITYSCKGPKSIFNLTSEEVAGFILHEIAHAKYTQNVSSRTWPDPAIEYATLMNCVEDIRVEKQLMNRFPGTYDSFRNLAVQTQNQLEEEFIKYVPNQMNYLLNLRQHQWKFRLFFKNKAVEDLFLDTLLLVKKAALLPTSTDLYDFVEKELWPKYKQIIEEREGDVSNDGVGEMTTNMPPQDNDPPNNNSNNNEENSNQQKQSQEQQQEQEKENNEQQQNNSNIPSSEKNDNEQTTEQSNQQSNSNTNTNTNTNTDIGNSSSQTPEEQQKEQERKQQVKQALRNAFKNKMPEMQELVNTIKDFSKNVSSNKGKTLGDEIEEEIKRQSEIEATKEQDNADSDPDVTIYKRQNSEDFKTYEELYADVKVHIPYFKMKLRSILRDNEVRRYGGAFTRGKLNNKLLYKWKCKSSRVFSKKLHRMHKNYVVTLLVDESGSMHSNDKHVNAARAAVLLSEVLNSVKIPFEIRGFNETERLYKSFDKPFNWTAKRNLENIIPSAVKGDNGNTNDAFAINQAQHSLLKEDAERILIVLCDGEPNPSGGKIPIKDYQRLKKAFHYYTDFDLGTEVAKAKKRTLVVGVGIQSDSVTEHYQHNVVCNTVSDLPKLVLGIIKKNIRRG